LVFLDASALAKAYLEEEGSTNVQGVLDRQDGSLFLSEFVALEVLTTLRTAYRKAPRPVYQRAVDRFRADYPSRFSIIDVSAVIRASAMDLTTWRRTARARGMDVLHLATALWLQSARRTGDVTMVTSDRDLAALSKECGLRTFDPSREPLAALPARLR
jgi:predicted nucleic acid-binding protein